MGRGGDDVRRLKERFRQLDTSQDGKLDFKEILSLLRRGNPNMSERELQALFNVVDKNGDGKIDFDEFIDYIHSPSEVQAQEISVPEDVPDDVGKVFEIFCGRGADASMEGKAFAKLCKDCGLMEKNLTIQDIDIIFHKVKTRSARTISLFEFLKALTLVAEKKGMDVYDLYGIVGDSMGPVVNGTQAESVRFYDDKSTYTGVCAKIAAEASGGHRLDELADLLEKEKRQLSRLAVGGRFSDGSVVGRSPRSNLPAGSGQARRDSPPRDNSPIRTVADDDTDWGLVEPAYRAYAASPPMEYAEFLKLLKDCEIVDGRRFKVADAEWAFGRVLVRGTGGRIGLEQFQEALRFVAARKHIAPYFIQAAVASNRNGAMSSLKPPVALGLQKT